MAYLKCLAIVCYSAWIAGTVLLGALWVIALFNVLPGSGGDSEQLLLGFFWSLPLITFYGAGWLIRFAATGKISVL